MFEEICRNEASYDIQIRFEVYMNFNVHQAIKNLDNYLRQCY